jgi:hypothetical protein
MLAADARVEGAGGGLRAAMGREEIVANMAPILEQIHGHVQEVSVWVCAKSGGG